MRIARRDSDPRARKLLLSCNGKWFANPALAMGMSNYRLRELLQELRGLRLWHVARQKNPHDQIGDFIECFG